MSKLNTGSLISQIKGCFDKDSQIVETPLCVDGEDIVLFYIEPLIDKKLFSEGVLAPIEKLVQKSEQKSAKSKENSEKNQQKSQDIIDIIKKQIISVSAVEEIGDVTEAIDKLFSGNVLVVSQKKMLVCPVYGLQARGVEEPPTSRVVKGPREGFVEDLPRNIGLIRKRLKTPNLKIKELCVGKQTNTQIAIVYLDGIAKSDIVKKVEDKISQINIDGIIDSYYIESFLEEGKIKFFRRVGNTEKPDVLCSKILEGRVAVLVDGSPIALTVPFVLIEDLQSPEDYYTIPAQATFVRIMRFIGLIFAILIPGVYVALQSFNYRILPINFLITLLSSIEGLSVPPLVELLLVLFLFEIITEASLQMPGSLGMALSIIGALALGNTAVDAGIISPPSIVIVAISSVALYIIPNQISETRMLRVLFTVIGGIVGLYGIVTSFIILTTYLCSVTSFGVPYLSPIAPSIKSDKKDLFIKQPVEHMDTRPTLIVGKNKVRQRETLDNKNTQQVSKQNNKNTNSNKTQENKHEENLIQKTAKNTYENQKNNKNSNKNQQGLFEVRGVNDDK